MLICSLERPPEWRCENPQQEEHSTMVEQRGLNVGMKAIVVFIRKTGVGSGSNKEGRRALLAPAAPGELLEVVPPSEIKNI